MESDKQQMEKKKKTEAKTHPETKGISKRVWIRLLCYASAAFSWQVHKKKKQNYRLLKAVILFRLAFRLPVLSTVVYSMQIHDIAPGFDS